MLDTLGRVSAALSSLPGLHLLVFTLTIWVVFSLILMANPQNKLNQWCFVGGMVFSLGALKEYLYYGIGPSLIASGAWTVSGSQMLYSLLSAAFYLLSIPCVLIFSFYFARLNRIRIFPLLRIAVWLPAVYLSLLFPPFRTLLLQSNPIFCLSIAGYNWLGGLIATAIIGHALHRDRLDPHYGQRRLAAVSLLIPLWVWLVAAFPYHALGIPNLSKIWQIELPVVLLALGFFLYHAFRDGIWGIRFRRETYDWNGSGSKVLQRNTQYVAHALKNDLNKIDWCVSLLSEQLPENREIAIIRSSVAHLRALIRRTRTHTELVTLEPSFCDVRALFDQLIRETPHTAALTIEIAACDDAPLWGDKTHIREMLFNLVSNASEAMHGAGKIVLSYVHSAHKAVITVSDNGPGMTQAQQNHIFEPYFTTKTSGENFGLGLYYCQNAISAHGGRITVKSAPGEGCVFSLIFPISAAGRETH